MSVLLVYTIATTLLFLGGGLHRQPFATAAEPWNATAAPTPSPTAPGTVTTLSSFYGQECLGLAYASGTSMYVTSSNHHVIYTVPLSGGPLVRIAGSPDQAGYANGVGTTARFRRPYGIVYDSYRVKFFIADEGNNQIRSLGVQSRRWAPEVQLYAGSPTAEMGLANGPTTQARFSGPTAIATSGSSILVADRLNGFVRRIDVHGYVRSLASIRIGGSSLTALAATNYFCYTVEMYAIVRIDVSSGQKVVFAGSYDEYGDVLPMSGTPISLSSARFTTVNSLTALSDNTLLAALGSNKIARLMPSSSQIYLYAGTVTNVNRDGVGTNASLRNPTVVQSVMTTSGETAYVVSAQSMGEQHQMLHELTVPNGVDSVATAVPAATTTPTTDTPNSNLSGAVPPSDGVGTTVAIVVTAMVVGVVLLVVGIAAGCFLRGRLQKKGRSAAPDTASPSSLGEPEALEMQPTIEIEVAPIGIPDDCVDCRTASIPGAVTFPTQAQPVPPPYQPEPYAFPSSAVNDTATAQGDTSNGRSEVN